MKKARSKYFYNCPMGKGSPMKYTIKKGVDAGRTVDVFKVSGRVCINNCSHYQKDCKLFKGK